MRTLFAWTRTRHAHVVVRNLPMAVVSGVQPVNGATPERRTEYPPRWGGKSRWVRGHSGWRCEFLRSQERASPEPPHSPPPRREQVEPAAMESGCTLPELSPSGSVDVRLLPIHTHRHLPAMAARTRQSLQRVGTNERTRSTSTYRLLRSANNTPPPMTVQIWMPAPETVTQLRKCGWTTG